MFVFHRLHFCMFKIMSRIFWGLVLLLSFGLAQAQLVPKGMVLSGDSHDSTATSSDIDSPSTDSSGVNSVVPPFAADSDEVSVDLKNISPFQAEILGKFQQDYNYNMMKSDDFHRYSRITSWSSIGLILAGLTMLAVDSNINSPWCIGGISAISTGVAGNIVSFSFDFVSHAYRVEAGNIRKNMTQYLQNNFSIPIMQE